MKDLKGKKMPVRDNTRKQKRPVLICHIVLFQRHQQNKTLYQHVNLRIHIGGSRCESAMMRTNRTVRLAFILTIRIQPRSCI